jgi:hypothetical protein
MKRRGLICVLAALVCARSAAAQQRPLVTEDPEPVGAGRVLLEGGVDYSHGVQYTVSGLTGNLTRIPILGVSVGISSIAELQIDAGPYDRLSITGRKPAPLSSLLTVTGDTTHDVDDVVIGMKIRLAPETASRPAFGFRFATKLPNAQNETGLGLDTTDFFASILTAKTIQSVRVVGNIGAAILGDPTDGERQNDVLTYGLSFSRAMTQKTEIVGEINGRASTRNGGPLPGTESRGLLKLGGRFTQGPVRFDAAIFFGLNAVDPTVGFTTGFTYVFNAFKVP